MRYPIDLDPEPQNECVFLSPAPFHPFDGLERLTTGEDRRILFAVAAPEAGKEHLVGRSDPGFQRDPEIVAQTLIRIYVSAAGVLDPDSCRKVRYQRGQHALPAAKPRKRSQPGFLLGRALPHDGGDPSARANHNAIPELLHQYCSDLMKSRPRSS